MVRHPLIRSLLSLQGNARACVYTEPLWGIPYNLYAPYASLYMVSFGLSDSQIGSIASIGLLFQVFWALLSGAITDRLGRKRTTLIFDLLCWSVPCLIWAFSQNFTWFLAAALVNSTWRVSMNSWSCLMVEDTPPAQLMDIYTWVYIAGLSAAFFAPVAGLLIDRFSLIPTMRGLYLFAMAVMTIKFLTLNFFARETTQGIVRMQETRHQSLQATLGEYRGVLKLVIHSPKTLAILGLMLVASIVNIIRNTFWAILATEKIGIPQEHIALFPFVLSTAMLIFFFTIMPRIKDLPFRNPILAGIACYLASYVVLILTPEKGYFLLLVSVVLEACGMAMVAPSIDRLIVVTVEPQERARIMAILYVAVIVFTSPFGWIAGQLSTLDKILPFILNMALFVIGAILAILADRLHRVPAIT